MPDDHIVAAAKKRDAEATKEYLALLEKQKRGESVTPEEIKAAEIKKADCSEALEIAQGKHGENWGSAKRIDGRMD
jgi:hypothetical protein